jgi:choline-sulfatase
LLFAVALALSSSCARLQHRDPLNILIIVVDTLRADHLGCYGGAPRTTPNIDALASQGARFSTVVTAAPVTAPSVASLLTSTAPIFHAVRDNEKFRLSDNLPNMATAFREAGYSTAAFVSSAVLDSRGGFDNGFDHYDDEMQSAYRAYDKSYASQAEELRGTQRRADNVTAAAIDWLQERGRRRPFMCLVHYFDPHDPYDPPPKFKKGPTRDPYDGEIAFTDSQIGVLLSGLRGMGLEKNTLVVLTADHGEGLGEHSERTHGFFLYDSTVLVPLIVRAPGAIKPGQVFDQQVRTIDLAPTILELAGLDAPSTMQGASLAGALRGEEELHDRPAYMETFRTFYSYNWHELVGIRTPRWKYVRAPEEELYDLATDRGELQNLAGEESDVVSQMELSLQRLEKELGAGADLYRARDLASDPEMARKMRALGYLGGESDGDRAEPGAEKDLPDPKAKIAELNARQEAGGHLRIAMNQLLGGDYDGALKSAAAAERLAPGYAETRATRGLILVRMGDTEEGIELLMEALKRDPESTMAYQTWNNLGLAYLKVHRCEDAIEAIKTSLSMKSDYPNAKYNLGLAYESCGKPADAVRAYSDFLAADPAVDPSLLSSLRSRMDALNSRLQGGGPADEHEPSAGVSTKN